MEHSEHKCKEDHCYICKNSFYQCSICGSSEGEVTTDCPGKQTSFSQRHSVLNKMIDFKDGKWIELK